MMSKRTKTILQVLDQYDLNGQIVSVAPYGQGHINDTYLVTVSRFGKEEPAYVIQRINKKVFSNVELLMQNITRVSAHIRKKIKLANDPRWEALTLVLSKQGSAFSFDDNGDYWRIYLFVKNSRTYNSPEKDGLLYESGLAYGKFSEMLNDFPAQELYETIPKFHDTEARMLQLYEALHEDRMHRKQKILSEIDFAIKHENDASYFNMMREQGALPIRVTHNDTKLNNVLFDVRTDKAKCVIDLDTVMPGLLAFDYGDAVRFGANTVAEDEKDLEKCHINLHRFKEYTVGFLVCNSKTITQNEIDTLPMGAKIMTLESGIRFLTDYLNGDVYFKTKYPDHNLDRARNQFALVADMEINWDKMRKIVVDAAKDAKNGVRAYWGNF